MTSDMARKSSERRTSSGRVFVVGSVNTDYVVRVPHIPKPGETVLGEDVVTTGGGKGANQAVAAARAGTPTWFVGAFGEDDLGKARRSALEKSGVKTDKSTVAKGVVSGIALINLASSKAGAENSIVVSPGSNARLGAKTVEAALRDLNDGDTVLCSLEVPLETVARALALAKRAGARAVLNPAPFPPSGLPKTMLSLASLITPNESEFAALAGAPVGSKKAAAFCKKLCESTGVILAVTRGASGADIYDRSGYRAGVAKPPKVKVVDTVGAGDCFNGYLSAELSRGAELETAVQFAVTAASLSVTRHGAQDAMPLRREVLKLL
jgi:ribokinase